MFSHTHSEPSMANIEVAGSAIFLNASFDTANERQKKDL